MILDFPSVHQATNWTCGPAALQSILFYYGLYYREDELVAPLTSDREEGTDPEGIVKFCRTLGFTVEEKENMSIGDVASYLVKRIPVLVMYQAWGESEEERKKWYRDVWEEGALLCGDRAGE